MKNRLVRGILFFPELLLIFNFIILKKSKKNRLTDK